MKNNFPGPAPEPDFTDIDGRTYTAYTGAFVLHPDGRIEAVEPKSGKVFAYEELNGFVGGYIEVLPLRWSRYMVINEDGKRLKLPVNEGATLLARANGLPADDCIIGPALVCSLDQMD